MKIRAILTTVVAVVAALAVVAWLSSKVVLFYMLMLMVAMLSVSVVLTVVNAALAFRAKDSGSRRISILLGIVSLAGAVAMALIPSNPGLGRWP